MIAGEKGEWVAHKAIEQESHWTIWRDGQILFTCWTGEADARRVCALHNGTPGLQSLGMWWAMIEAERELAGDPKIPDDAVVLPFMGSGASHNVTAGDIRNALDSEGSPK